MNINVGDKALITTSQWFYGTDGNHYQAVFGTVKGVYDDREALGIKTNARSANWYVEIGDTTIAGCQIHYAVKCEQAPPDEVVAQAVKDGVVTDFKRKTYVWNADAAS